MKRIVLTLAVIAALIGGGLFGISSIAAEPTDLSAAEITTKYEEYTYTGEEIQPAVVVKLGNTKLTRDTDYTVSYSDNVNVGTATITVNGIGEYTGNTSKTFKVKTRSVADKNFKVTVKTGTRVGSQPQLSVTYNDKTLVNDKDYTYTVSGTDKAGYKTGKIKIKGMGNFGDKDVVEFNVYPTKVTGIKASNIKPKSLTLTWSSKASEGVSGYKLYRADNEAGKNLRLLKTSASNSINLSNIDSATKYCFFVVAYKTNDGKTVTGDRSNVYVTCTKPKQVQLNYVVKKSGNRIYANWESVYNPSGYQIKYSLDRKMKNNAKTVKAKASKNGKNIKVPDNGYAYFVKVRAYKTYTKNGKKKTVYGPWSVKMSSIFGRVYKQYTTSYPYNPNRTTNLKLACKAIDGKILNPGEVFSFNGTVGQRTTAKGYKPATIFTGPNSHADGVGGGICQVASTMFNAALLANFPILERYQHSQKVAYCPVGRDAAIFWGSENFRFKNNLKYPVKIRMSCENGKITCQYRVSYKIKAPKVSLSVTKSGKTYTLKRSVKGNVNYTTRSTY